MSDKCGPLPRTKFRALPSGKALAKLGAFAVLLGATQGCGWGKGPASPFDKMESSNVIAYRLQNYEPPAQQQAQVVPGLPVPALPPEVSQWVQMGAQSLGLSQFIPPGMLPGTPGAAAPVPSPTEPRFHGFRILGSGPTQVLDPEVRERLGELFGDADNFDNKHANCAYSEFGFSFSPQQGIQNDLLVSFSCNQVVAQTFAWPHPSAGMKPDTVKELSELMLKIWPAGA
jgi:hypothetical protein